VGKVLGIIVGVAMIFFLPVAAFLAPSIFVGLATTSFAGMTVAGFAALQGTMMALSSTIALLKSGGPNVTHNQDTSQLTIRQPISYRRIIYGHVRLGGVLTFIGVSGSNNEYLHMVLTVAGHKVHNIDTSKLYMDGVEVPLTFEAGDGAYHPSVGNKYRAHMQVEFDNGDPADSSQPFPNLAAAGTGGLSSLWTSNHLQRGCAKVHIRLVWDATIFANGLPQSIAFEIDGKEVYDPRTDTTGYSNNPALCLRDWLTDTRYGMAADAETIDDDYVTAAANICDEDVDLKAGGTQKCYTCDGAFDASEQRGDVINGILSSMAGMCVPPGNAWRMYAGAWRTPVFELTDDDLRGAIKMDTKVSRRDLANTITGVYVSPDNNWQPSDFPPYQDADALADDGEYIATDIQLGFTTNGIRAQRLAKIKLEKIRRQKNLVLACKLKALELQPGDTVEFTHDRFGFDAKTFEVLQTSLVQDNSSDNKSLVVGVDLVLKEADSDIYAWDATTDEREVVVPSASLLPDITTVGAPSDLACESGSTVALVRSDGIRHTRIEVAWTAPTDTHVLSGGHINVYVADHSLGNWRLAAVAAGDDVLAYISDVTDGDVYDVKINAVNSAGAESLFVEVDGITASDDAATFAGTVSSLDNVNDGVNYGKTQQLAGNLIPDSDFEFGTTYWTRPAHFTVVPGGGQHGGNAIQMDWNAVFMTSAKMPASSGVSYCLSAFVDQTALTSSPGSRSIFLQVNFKDSGGSNLLQSSVSFDVNNDIVSQSGAVAQIVHKYSTHAARIAMSCTAPAGTVSMVLLTPQGNSEGSAGSLLFSAPQLEVGTAPSPYAPRIQDQTTGYLVAGSAAIDFTHGIHINKTIDNIADGSTYNRVLATALTSGSIDPSKSGVLTKGSMPKSTGNGLTFTTTTTTITINWTGVRLLRADGTSFSVPDGSQVVTGLTANTTYQFYPYLDESSGTLKFVTTGDATTMPTIAGVKFTSLTAGFVSTTSSVTPNTSALSIEFWFRNADTVNGFIVGHTNSQTGTPATFNVWLQQNGGFLTLHVKDSGGTDHTLSSVSSINDGNWHHIVVTQNTGTGSIYIDGVLDKTGATTTASYVAGFWRMSDNEVNLNDHVTAMTLAHVAIYNGTVLSTAAITKDYQAMVGGGGPSAYATSVLANAGLTYYWKLTETSGTSAADSQGTNTGTYQNTFTLNQSAALISALGSPAIAWPSKTFENAQVTILQGHVPYSDGALTIATPSSGTGGGSGGSGGGHQIF
jgi:hypothetical protein